MGTTKPPLVANRSNTSQQKQHKNEVTCKFSPRPPFFERGFMPCPGAGANKEAAADGRRLLLAALEYSRGGLLERRAVGIRPPLYCSREPSWKKTGAGDESKPIPSSDRRRFHTVLERILRQ